MVSNIGIMMDGLVEEGMEKGIEKGLEKGMEKEKYIIAKNMLESEIEVETVSKCTGLSIKELEQIKKELKYLQ